MVTMTCGPATVSSTAWSTSTSSVSPETRVVTYRCRFESMLTVTEKVSPRVACTSRELSLSSREKLVAARSSMVRWPLPGTPSPQASGQAAITRKASDVAVGDEGERVEDEDEVEIEIVR